MSRVGCVTTAQASPRRWIIPRENPRTRRSATPSSPVVVSASVTQAGSTAARERLAARVTASRAVNQLSNSGTSGHTPMAVRGGRCVMVPPSACRTPVMIDSKVVLPAPFGPTRP